MTDFGHNYIDYLKIDVEGSELDLFEDLIENHPEILQSQIGQIAVEFHWWRGYMGVGYPVKTISSLTIIRKLSHE